MDVVATLAGIALIVVGLRDMFQTLLQPAGHGMLSKGVLRIAWAATRPMRTRIGTLAGTLGMLGGVALWIALQALGWALIYLPHVPGGFLYSPGIDAGDYGPFAEALYISAVTLATLGFGDVVATDPWLRFFAPLEALTGFALLTAAMTWFSQIYPPLTRRRALALQLGGMADTDLADAVPELPPETLSRVLDGLTTSVAAVRVDFAQHGEGFFFRETSPALAIARQLPYALRRRDAAAQRAEPEVRLSTRQLTSALEQLADTLRSEFLREGDGVEGVLAAFVVDHGHEPRA